MALQRNASVPVWGWVFERAKDGAPLGAVRLGEFKLIEWHADMSVELYNLQDDLGEQHDLARENPAQTAALPRLRDDWREQVTAQMPTANANYDPNWRPARQATDQNREINREQRLSIVKAE